MTIRRSRLRFPASAVGLERSSSFADGLAFYAPLALGAGLQDLRTGKMASPTGGHGYHATKVGLLRAFGSGQYLDFPAAPVGIGPTTPATVAWVQEHRATSAQSTVLHVQLGTVGADSPLLIYQSASTAAYYFTAGPSRGASSAHSWSSAIGAATAAGMTSTCW
jgi:hypothetical protein